MEINKGCSVSGAQLWGPSLPPEPTCLTLSMKGFSVHSWVNRFLKSSCGINFLIFDSTNLMLKLQSWRCLQCHLMATTTSRRSRFGRGRGVSLLFCAICSLLPPGNEKKMGFLLDFCHNKRLTASPHYLDKVGLSAPRFSGNFLHHGY